MRPRSLLALTAAFALLVAVVWVSWPRPRSRGFFASSAAKPVAAASASAPGRPAATALGHPPGEEPSHLADDLNAPTGDIHADLRALNEIFRQYRSSIHGLNPVGENAEITAVLTGHNRLDFAFIPPGHPAINAQGELCDRWGTPFFFHALSGTQMEIRSAGPDRVMWTADDQVLTPGLYEPQR